MSIDTDLVHAGEPSPRIAGAVGMPVFQCTACGKPQLRSLSEVRSLIPAALVHAFKGAAIKAPG